MKGDGKMNSKIKESMSNSIINIALQVAKMPNQSCAIMFGKAHTDLAIKESDYKNYIRFMKDRINKE